MKTVKYDVEYDEKAGRMELLVRLIWSIPSMIVWGILLAIYGICWMLQFLAILITGKRMKVLYDWSRKYVAYTTKFYSYWAMLTDERNPIMPED